MILGQRNTRRDFLFVDDFVNLVHKILRNFPEGYNVYNVGSGKSYSLEEILRIIESIVNKKISTEYDFSLRPNDIHETVADIGKVKKEFEWRPTTNIEVGLRLTIEKYSQMINTRKDSSL